MRISLSGMQENRQAILSTQKQGIMSEYLTAFDI